MKAHVLSLTLIAAVVGSQAASAEPSKRIIGGQEASIDQYPYMAGLVNRGDDARNVFCGAAVLNSQWIVTAAHCLVGEKANNLDVLTGVDDVSTTAGERLPVKRIIVHPNYDDDAVLNDIALLELYKPTSAPGIRAATSSDVALEQTGQPVSVAGWGNTSTTGEQFPTQLRDVNLQIADFAACNAAFGGLENVHLCAWIPGGGKDSCQGDSGGPLVARGNEGPVLVGIVSFGDDCGSATHPGVYAKVSQFGAFLQQAGSTAGLGPVVPPVNPVTPPVSPPMTPPVTPPVVPPVTPPVAATPNVQDEDGVLEIQDVFVYEWIPFEGVPVHEYGEAVITFENDSADTVVVSDINIVSAQGVEIDYEDCGYAPLERSDYCDVELSWMPSELAVLDAKLTANLLVNGTVEKVVFELAGEAVQSLNFEDDYEPGDWQYFTDEPDDWWVDYSDYDNEHHFHCQFGESDESNLYGWGYHDDDWMYRLQRDSDGQSSEFEQSVEFSLLSRGATASVFADGQLVAEYDESTDWETHQITVAKGAKLHWQFKRVAGYDAEPTVQLKRAKNHERSVLNQETPSADQLSANLANGLGTGSLGPFALIAALGALGLRRRRLA